MTNITTDEMVYELKRMLTPQVRTSEEVQHRTEVFRAIIKFIKDTEQFINDMAVEVDRNERENVPKGL